MSEPTVDPASSAPLAHPSSASPPPPPAAPGAGDGGSVREVAFLAAPVVLTMLSQTFLHVADTFFVGRLGTAEQGAVGVAGTVTWTLYSFFFGTLNAVQIFVAQHVGARSPASAGQVTWQGIYFAVAAALPISAVGLAGEPVFHALGLDAALVPHAVSYFEIRLLGAAGAFLAITGVSYLRGLGDTRTPMVITMLTTGANILLDYLLIFGHLGLPRLEVAGAAWATVIAESMQAVIVLTIFERRARREGHLVRAIVPPARRSFTRLVRVGLPVGVQWVLEMGSWTVFTIFIAQLGKVEAAAHQIATAIIHVSFMPGYGVSIAATTLVGQYLGARDRISALRSARSALGLAISFMSAMGVLFVVERHALIRLFNGDPGVVAVGGRLLVIAAVFQVFDATNMVLSGVLRGAGDTRFPMIASVVTSWLVFIPLVWLLVSRLGYGVAGGWMAAVVWIAGQAMMIRHRYVRRGWMEKLVVPLAADEENR